MLTSTVWQNQLLHKKCNTIINTLYPIIKTSQFYMITIFFKRYLCKRLIIFLWPWFHEPKQTHMLMRKKNLASVDLDFESHNEKQLIKEKTTHNFNPPQKINGTQLHTLFGRPFYCQSECPLLSTHLCYLCHFMAPTFPAWT